MKLSPVHMATLGMEERAVYGAVVVLMWIEGGRLLADDPRLFLIVDLAQDDVRAAILRLVKKRIFKAGDGYLRALEHG